MPFEKKDAIDPGVALLPKPGTPKLLVRLENDLNASALVGDANLSSVTHTANSPPSTSTEFQARTTCSAAALLGKVSFAMTFGPMLMSSQMAASMVEEMASSLEVMSGVAVKA